MIKRRFESPVGNIVLTANSNELLSIEFGGTALNLNFESSDDLLLKEVQKQLLEYFEGSRRKFDIPFSLPGTDYQKKVYNELLKIPYGQTRSYGEIARSIGSPKGSRAVGGANNKNCLPIIIPCHRVIGSDGKLVGYAGGLQIKKWLLDLENTGVDY
ncbi:methylated-DNA--[protein]-cysteine S-methyltransferase [Alkalibacter mobilis]|uniref:methylated-DNA--[protein]-cysteine S-methyltransferase n=1 Tax=Alkalibacter mobilis TaxID=2787712 RepID=UPI00189EA1D8|nr:methylated-DNA--[protein]-cysteine S-methyltransferase [Alkalibacter mobilis]MBF7096588.1 methylated-DNA--[protein]-cysteine S-methyltransferase [Alkalibacter mobilis]